MPKDRSSIPGAFFLYIYYLYIHSASQETFISNHSEKRDVCAVRMREPCMYIPIYFSTRVCPARQLISPHERRIKEESVLCFLSKLHWRLHGIRNAGVDGERRNGMTMNDTRTNERAGVSAHHVVEWGTYLDDIVESGAFDFRFFLYIFELNFKRIIVFFYY